MLKVGITGIIGAGKSTVASVLSLLGVSIYNCDKEAKELMRTVCLRDIIKILGSEVVCDDGSLNREYIASKIFSDYGLKTMVESVVHSALHRDMIKWFGQHNDENYVIVESAILFGSIIESEMDRIVVVTASQEEIIQRVIKRDGVTTKQVEARLQNQLNQNEMIKRADEVIYTSNFEPITPKVVALHKKLLTLSSK